MRNFITDAACCGRRPKGVKAGKLRSRPLLLKKMMADRGVARFIVAPRGFGKTSLAFEYADSIFDFKDVFWINGQSPCFLRDLDNGVVVSRLFEATARRSLAVFEDVPYLDDERSDEFSRVIDELLAKDWEVVAVMTPALDSFAERQNDRACIFARDLLLDDAELEAAGAKPRDVAASGRVPSLVWGGEEGVEILAEGMRSPDMPAEIQLAVFVMEVLGEGTIEDVCQFAHGLKKDTRRFIEEHYPYVGLDLVDECFSAHELSIDALSRAFHGVLDDIASRAGSLGHDVLVSRLASMLARRGRFSRACALVEAFCPRRRRSVWIEAEQGRYLALGEVASMQRLFDSLGDRPSGLSPALLLGTAVRLYLLGDRAGAGRFAWRAIRHPHCTEELACAAALTAHACDSHERADRLRALLENAAARDFGQGGALSHAARVRLCMSEGLAQVVAALDEAGPEAWAEPAYVCEVAYAIERARTASDDDVAATRLFDRICSCGASCLRACRAASDAPRLWETLLCDALGERAWRDEAQEQRRVEVESFDAALFEQRNAWSTSKRPRSSSVRASRRIRPSDDVEPMEVRLFGGLEVSIGGEIVDPTSFVKQRSKTLLALLVLHRGKEVARQELLDILWPDSTGDRAVNNFYSLWSSLKAALACDSDEGPYVVRHQLSCMVDSRYVHSDVEEFEQLCRALFFGPVDVDEWLRIYTRLQDDFSCDLMPSETDTLYIVRLRERFRNRLVDAYITAADRLCDAGEPRAALWYAHAAVDAPAKREDAYCSLMRAQMLAGQRSLAMETFVECRTYMAEELGMDPSERVMSLHRELIACMREGSPVSKPDERSSAPDVLK